MNDEELTMTLRYINAVRKRCGLIPLVGIPKGIPPDNLEEIGRLCPLARAIPNTIIAVDFVRTPDERTANALSRSFGMPLQSFIEFPGEFVIDLPEALMDFITHYDDGQLPQFIEEA